MWCVARGYWLLMAFLESDKTKFTIPGWSRLAPWKHHVPPIWPSAKPKQHVIPVDGDDNYCSHREHGWYWLAHCWVSLLVFHILIYCRHGSCTSPVISPLNVQPYHRHNGEKDRIVVAARRCTFKRGSAMGYVLWRAVITVLPLLMWLNRFRFFPCFILILCGVSRLSALDFVKIIKTGS